MTRPVITVVDYGVGNVASVANMLKRAGIDSRLSGDPEVISTAQKLILPGVGAFDRAARILRETGLKAAILSASERGAHIMGVCLGMQLLLDGSDEGEGTESGLGLIPGRVRRFPAEVEQAGLKVPHMGWNLVNLIGSSPVLPSANTNERYYFVHSYIADPEDARDRLAVTRHGVEFTSMVARENVVGAQFHPEKSRYAGMGLLAKFSTQE
jgi:glutamine amidotransferase